MTGEASPPLGQTPGVLLRAGLLLALTALLAAGCSIDRVEWESSGFPVEEVAHVLEEEHGVSEPEVECIQREVQGADWECRAHSAEGDYHCHAATNQAAQAGLRGALRGRARRGSRRTAEEAVTAARAPRETESTEEH